MNLHGFGQDHVQAPLVNLTVKVCDPVSESECNDLFEIPLACAGSSQHSLTTAAGNHIIINRL